MDQRGHGRLETRDHLFLDAEEVKVEEIERNRGVWKAGSSLLLQGGTMGCTTSTLLLEGLRSILERNCGYVKGAVVEPGALEEEEEILSLRGSQLWIPTAALVKPF